MNETPPTTPEPVPTTTIDVDATPAVPDAAPPAPAVEMSPAATAAKLKELFPGLFAGPGFKPLKLRVQADIQARAPGVFTKAQLSAFLRRHTGSTGYLIALTRAKQRFDLDGAEAGELTEEHLAAAREELVRRKGLQQDRVAAEQEQMKLLQQQRYNRAGLLHDYERTTLTLANFCVLKGVTPEELPGLLEIARQERAEAPPVPPQRPEPRRGNDGGDNRADRSDRRPAGPKAGDRRGPPPRGARPPAGKR